MNEESQIARRTVPRHELERVLAGQTEYSAPILLIDLSTTGALIEHHRYLKPGVEVTLRMPLGGESHRVRSTVVHCAVYQMQPVSGKTERAIYRIGVKFRDLTPDARRLIQDLIRERLQNERREQPRLFVGRRAQIEETVELRALNISSSGGLFLVCQPLELSSEHEFVFRLPSAEVRTSGVVRHCEAWAHGESEPRFQVGIEFTIFHGDAEQRIREYLVGLDSTATTP